MRFLPRQSLLLAPLFLGLAACGHGHKSSEDASSDNVEMPAEEAISGATGAMPTQDPSATATEGAAAAPVQQTPDEAAAAAAIAASSATAGN